MIETIRPNDGIDEHKFGYNAKIEGYTNSSSDMKELYEIARNPKSLIIQNFRRMSYDRKTNN
jgi:hypothetical protein